jgi:hypothetical protein
VVGRAAARTASLRLSLSAWIAHVVSGDVRDVAARAQAAAAQPISR